MKLQFGSIFQITTQVPPGLSDNAKKSLATESIGQFVNTLLNPESPNYEAFSKIDPDLNTEGTEPGHLVIEKDGKLIFILVTGKDIEVDVQLTRLASLVERVYYALPEVERTEFTAQTLDWENLKAEIERLNDMQKLGQVTFKQREVKLLKEAFKGQTTTLGQLIRLKEHYLPQLSLLGTHSLGTIELSPQYPTPPINKLNQPSPGIVVSTFNFAPTPKTLAFA